MSGNGFGGCVFRHPSNIPKMVKSNKIMNPKTGRLVTRNGKIGKELQDKAARIIQKAYFGHSFDKFKGNYNAWTNAIDGRFNLRFAQTVKNRFGELPSLRELTFIATQRGLNPNYFDIKGFKNHYGVRNVFI